MEDDCERGSHFQRSTKKLPYQTAWQRMTYNHGGYRSTLCGATCTKPPNRIPITHLLNDYNTIICVNSSKVIKNSSINRISLFGNAISNAVVREVIISASECILLRSQQNNCTSLGATTQDKRNWLVALSILRLLAKTTKGQTNWCITQHAPFY